MAIDRILKSDFALADFYSNYCTPCKTLSPIIDDIAKNYMNIDVIKVNIDKDTEIARKYGIMSVPTVVFFKKGEVLEKVLNPDRKTLIKKIENYLSQSLG